MSRAARPTRRRTHQRPLRVFDRSIALARFRWEILRRTADYRADIRNILHSLAATRGCPASALKRECLERGGGVILPAFGDGVGNPEHYDGICRRYGLRTLIHPEVRFSDDEIAAFPVFADTPARQPVVKDLTRLRHVARRGGNISSRTLRRIFTTKPIAAGPFRPSVKRLHLGRLEMILAVFDARTQGTSFRRIATDVHLKLDQVKRAWAMARGLVSKWFDFEPHLRSCAECHRYGEGKRDRMCAKAEQQIGLRATGGSRLRPLSAGRLDLVHARRQGELPARRSARQS